MARQAKTLTGAVPHWIKCLARDMHRLLKDGPVDQPDIVDRLRASMTQARALDRSELLAEAADEIDRLRAEWASMSSSMMEMRRKAWLADAPNRRPQPKTK